jgi:hypothetical protein
VWREIFTQDLAVTGHGFYPMGPRTWLLHVDDVFVPLSPNTDPFFPSGSPG